MLIHNKTSVRTSTIKTFCKKSKEKNNYLLNNTKLQTEPPWKKLTGLSKALFFSLITDSYLVIAILVYLSQLVTSGSVVTITLNNKDKDLKKKRLLNHYLLWVNLLKSSKPDAWCNCCLNLWSCVILNITRHINTIMGPTFPVNVDRSSPPITLISPVDWSFYEEKKEVCMFHSYYML